MMGAADAPALLEVTGLEVVYRRALTAIQGISLKVAEGSITALVGTNGAGKTTILTAIAGFMRADDVHITEGDIRFAGQSIARLENHQVSALGIGYVPEREKIFPTLTVEENLAACAGGDRSPRTVSVDTVYRRLFPRLGERPRTVAGYLSGGERQMLAISMALLGGPRLLLIDEMTLGLSPLMVVMLTETIQRLRAEFGMTILMVEQNAAMAINVADYVYVMENGRIVFDGTPDRLQAHQDFQEFYLGMGSGGAEKHYRDVKQYRRKRRWFG
jgi:branched-chain amino acid transport system ATP-binding protein